MAYGGYQTVLLLLSSGLVLAMDSDMELQNGTFQAKSEDRANICIFIPENPCQRVYSVHHTVYTIRV